MTGLHEEGETLEIEEKLKEKAVDGRSTTTSMTGCDGGPSQSLPPPLPSSSDNKVDIVDNESNLTETITMTPNAPLPPCPPPPPPPPPFEGFQFDEDNHNHQQEVEEGSGKEGFPLVEEDHTKQSNEIEEAEETKQGWTETDDAVVEEESDLLDLVQSAPETEEHTDEECTAQEEDLLNLSELPPPSFPVDGNDAMEKQDVTGEDGTAYDENIHGEGGGRGWGLFRRISSRNTTDPATRDDTNTCHSSDEKSEEKGETTPAGDTEKKDETNKTQKPMRNRQRQGQMRRRRWGLGRVQSNNSDSENDAHNYGNDKEVEEDYDGVVVDEEDGSDDDGVKKKVVLDAGGGLRIVEQETEKVNGKKYDQNNNINDGGEAPQRRYWGFRRNNWKQDNNNDDDADNNGSAEEEEEEEKEREEEEEENSTKEREEEETGEEQEDDQLIGGKKEVGTPLRRYWSFRRGARQYQHHEHDDNGNEGPLLKMNDDDFEEKKQFKGRYTDDIAGKNNEEHKSGDDNKFVEYKDHLDSVGDEVDDNKDITANVDYVINDKDKNNSNNSASAQPSVPVVRRGFFGRRRYLDDLDVAGDQEEEGNIYNNDVQGSKEEEKEKEEYDEEHDEEEALTKSSTREGTTDADGGRVPWLGNHLLGSMKLKHHQQYSSSSLNSSSHPINGQEENEKSKVATSSISSTYQTTTSHNVSIKQDYYGTEVKSSAIIKDENSGEEKGASYYSFPTITDDNDDDEDEIYIEKYHGSNILDEKESEGINTRNKGGSIGSGEWRRKQNHQKEQNLAEEKTFMTSKTPPKGWRWSRQNRKQENQNIISSYHDDNDGLLSPPGQERKMEGFGNCDGSDYVGITVGNRASTEEEDENDGHNLLNKDNNNHIRNGIGLFSSFRKRNKSEEQEQKELKDYIERRTGGALESMPISTPLDNKNVFKGLKEGITNVAASIVAPELYPLDVMDQLGGDSTQGEYRFISTLSDDSDDDKYKKNKDVEDEEIMAHDRVKELEKIVEEKNDEIGKWRSRVQQLEEELRLMRQKQTGSDNCGGGGTNELNLLCPSSVKPKHSSSTPFPQSSHTHNSEAVLDMTHEDENAEDGEKHGKTTEFGDNIFSVPSTNQSLREDELIDLSSPSKDNECSCLDDDQIPRNNVAAAVTQSGGRVSTTIVSREKSELIDMFGDHDMTVEENSSEKIHDITDVFRDVHNRGEHADNDVASIREDQELIPLST